MHLGLAPGRQVHAREVHPPLREPAQRGAAVGDEPARAAAAGEQAEHRGTARQQRHVAQGAGVGEQRQRAVGADHGVGRGGPAAVEAVRDPPPVDQAQRHPLPGQRGEPQRAGLGVEREQVLDGAAQRPRQAQRHGGGRGGAPGLDRRQRLARQPHLGGQRCERAAERAAAAGDRAVQGCVHPRRVASASHRVKPTRRRQ
ncbi:MAG: hypothetical protein R3F59_22710 [Myxococcota bacterium]